MAGEVLSQAEVEHLLSLMSSPESTSASAIVKDTEETPVGYLDKSHLKTLQRMHNRFAQMVAAKLCSVLRTNIEVNLATVDQMIYGEFLFGVSNPTCFNWIKTLDSTQFVGDMLMDVNLSIVYPMINRILGGNREFVCPSNKPLTRIETRLVQHIIVEFLEELKEVWLQKTELDFDIVQTESDPQFISVIEISDPVVVLCLEVKMIASHSFITLCMPTDVIERLLDT